MKIILIKFLVCLIVIKINETTAWDWPIKWDSNTTDVPKKSTTESTITESSILSNDSNLTTVQTVSTESQLTTDQNLTFNSTVIQTVDSITTEKVVSTFPPDIVSRSLQEINQPELTDELDIKGCAVVDSFPELKTLFNNQFMSDFKIITDQNEEIKVHQIVLSLKSSVLADLLKNDYSGELKITHEEYPLYKKLIKFLYTEKITINNKTDFKSIEGIYSLAKKYEIKRLIKAIEEGMDNLINLDNFKSIFEFAIKQNMTKTIDKCRYFVRNNSKQIYDNKLYASDNQHIWDIILTSLDINSTQKLTLLREKGSGIDINRYKRYITIDECDKNELFILKDLKLFHPEDVEMLRQISNKLDQLCQSSSQIESLHERIRNQQNDFRNLDSEIRELRQSNQELKEMCRIESIPRQPLDWPDWDVNTVYGRPININQHRTSNRAKSQRPINHVYY